MHKLFIGIVAAIAVTAAAASAEFGGARQPVAFYTGHSHEGEQTNGAPEHSGGLDRYGCHNASVPYHCH